MRKSILLLLLPLLVSACTPTPSQDSIQTTIAQSQARQLEVTHTASPSSVEPIEPTNTSRPEHSPTPKLEPTLTDIHQDQSTKVLNDKLIEAKNQSIRQISVADPEGFEVVVDVPNNNELYKLLNRGSVMWDWDLRGFTREVDGQLQVWRTLSKAGEDDLGMWLEVVSSLEVPGHGMVTIEFDRNAMATRGGGDPQKTLSEIYLEDPESWRIVLEILWGGRESVAFSEAVDYGTITNIFRKTHKRPGQELFSQERLVKNAGITFLLVPEFDVTFNEAESWQNKTSLAFKDTSQAGRSVLIIFSDYWFSEFTGKGVRDFVIGYIGIATLSHMFEQGGQGGIEALVGRAGDKNPWRVPPNNSYPRTPRKALEALGVDIHSSKNFNLTLVGPED